MRRLSGFTLIELMIVVAIIAAIAIPNLLAAPLAANETSAISTLKSIASAQAQFQSSAKVDVDRGGTGEFGYFRELSGAVACRTETTGGNTGGSTLSPPVLSGAFRTLNAQANVSRSGYIFKVILSDAAGGAQSEDVTPDSVHTGSSPIVPDIAETTWACYGWPASYSNSGNRTFFVNQGGDITAKEDSAITGSSGIQTGSAFLGVGNMWSITGKVAIGTVGRDGKLWKQIN